MTDIKLFRLESGGASEIAGHAAAVEKSLQSLLESRMQTFLGVCFLATEYGTGKTHRGRIDTLGLDENRCPVIVEYKRHSNENVINQGLFYLDWLLDHQAEFYLLVLQKLGKEEADAIDWAGTRLLCIASDFTRYDQYAVQQIARNIELIRYKLFDKDLLLLELVNSVVVRDVTLAKAASGGQSSDANKAGKSAPKEKKQGNDKTFDEQLAGTLPEVKVVYEMLSSHLLSLGDDIQEKRLKLYTAFRRLKNFACVIAYPNKLLVIAKLSPSSIVLEEGFSRDVTDIGHWGTGDLELTLRTKADFEKAIPLLERAYQEG